MLNRDKSTKPKKHMSKLSMITSLVVLVIAGASVFALNRSTIKIDLLGDKVVLSPGTVRANKSINFGNQVSSNKASFAKRFFSEDASWNKPVSVFGESAYLDKYAEILWDYGGGPEFRVDGKSRKTGGGFFPSFKNFSVPIYDIKTATKTARLFQATWAQNQLTLSDQLKIGDSIPWNPEWRPGGYSDLVNQTDRIMAIVDYESGLAYELWRVEEPKLGCFDFFGPNGQAGYDLNDQNHLCIAGVSKYTNLFTAKEGSTIQGRGMGINKLALVTRADEVASGKIEHAMALTIANPMFGPTIASSYREAGAGSTKGFFLKPATRLEHSNPATLGLGDVTTAPIDDVERSKTNPSGMRFALKITDAEIENWLKKRDSDAQKLGDKSWSYSGAKSNTARIFAVAWRDYGAVVAETGGNGIGMEMDGIQGPAKATWEKLGIVDETVPGQTEDHYPVNDLFDGLITRERLYVVNPPE